jgi:hypothetical protein
LTVPRGRSTFRVSIAPSACAESALESRFVVFFKKKPAAPAADAGADEKAPPPQFEPQPEKARKWFEHAKTAAMSSNFDYAISCYANGIRLDPTAMSAHEAMLDAAVRYASGGGRPAAGRELKGIDDGTPIGRFAAAEFEWMKDLQNPKLAMRVIEAAAKAEQFEYANWIAGRVLNVLRSKGKPTKATWLQAMTAFRSVGAWDQSMQAGEQARLLDPADSDLDAELKNLSAQRAMDQGGYDEAAGKEGGFRRLIKDAARQQELLEAESLAGGASIDERNLTRAKTAYDAEPTLPDNINRYAQLLKKQGTAETVEQARRIYEKGHADTGEYRFRMAAGDIRIEMLERRLRSLEEQLAQSSDDGLAARRDETRSLLLQLKTTEYVERVEKYPTDRNRKYDLGLALFEQHRYEDAMPHFQAAKDEPKLRSRASQMLGRCFHSVGWYTEAISELEEALHALDATERDRELAVKYDLMLAQIEAARSERSIDFAKQAKTLCSEIARRNITYRDIRAKRKEVDDVIRDLGGSG